MSKPSDVNRKVLVRLLATMVAMLATGTLWASSESSEDNLFGGSAGVGTASSSFNSVFGAYAGSSLTSGYYNSLFGAGAGNLMQTGYYDTYVGFEAGRGNTAGAYNAYFGYSAGRNSSGTGNTAIGASTGFYSSGNYNSFVGYSAGANSTTAFYNTFLGTNSGFATNTGGYNVFLGYGAGIGNTAGIQNAAVGMYSGRSNKGGGYNSTFGTYADVVDGSNNATAIGFQSQASQNNTLVLGAIPGINEPVTGNSYVAVGMGTDAPGFPLHIKRADTTENLLRLEQSSATLKDRALMLLSNKGGTRFQFDNTATGNSWRFQAGTGGANNFEISDVDSGTGVIEFRLTDVGNLVIAGTLTQNSNVHDKTGIVPVNGDALLTRVEKLPISEWRYKNDAETPHVGPMAQDFYAAFKLGSDETKIAPGDMAGVALAAIKAQQQEIRRLEADNAALRAQVTEMSQTLGARLETLERRAMAPVHTAAN